jgi:hypothetical protein
VYLRIDPSLAVPSPSQYPLPQCSYTCTVSNGQLFCLAGKMAAVCHRCLANGERPSGGVRIWRRVSVTTAFALHVAVGTKRVQGGVRTTAFLSGGFLPANVRGTVNSKYIHITDWYRTFAELAGVSGDDPAEGVPPVDSLDMWPMLSDNNVSSPRTEIPLSSSHGPPGWGDGMSATGPCIVPGWSM